MGNSNHGSNYLHLRCFYKTKMFGSKHYDLMRRRKISEHRIFEIPQTSLKADYFFNACFLYFPMAVYILHSVVLQTS